MATKNQMVSESSPIDPALLEWAEYWYPISWKGLLVAGAVTAVAACLTIAFLLLQWHTSSIRERNSEWRTSALEVQAKKADADLAQAKADIANADARAADANARAYEAKLALEKFKAPRILTPEQQGRISAKVRQFAGTQFDAGMGPKGDPEPLYLLRSIHAALSSAGWSHIAWTSGGEAYTEAGMPSIGLTTVTNVIVDVHPDRWAKFGTAARALAEALDAEGIAAIADSQPTSVNTDAIHVRVGRKL